MNLRIPVKLHDWLNVDVYKRIRRIDIILAITGIGCVIWYGYTGGIKGAILGAVAFVLFMTALGQIGNAWSNLINQMGVAIAPTLTPFLENVRDLIVQITPGLVEFAKTISSVLGPALSGIVTTISVVVGALQVFFNAIATGINWAFGKEVTTGMDWST